MAGDHIGQRRAIHQFHDDGLDGVVLFEAVDLGDVWVIERRQRLGLPPEPLEPVGIGSQQRGKHLDGHVALQPGVVGAIHLTHASDAQQAEDLIDTDALAGGERHGRA